MGLNDVTFEKINGGLERQLPNEDHISGVLVYGMALPSGFGTDKVKRITCLEDAEGLGIAAGSVTYKELHYYISEFYRKAPGAILFIGIFTTPNLWETFYDFSEMITMQKAAEGKIRQYAIITSGVGATLEQDVKDIQKICNTLETLHMPASVLFASNISAVAIASLLDLRTLNCKNVSVVIGMDGSGVGAALTTSLSHPVTAIGAILGAVAKSSVHENIGWVKKFPMADTVELTVPALCNGDLISEVTDANISDINTKGYIFLIKHIGLSDTYINDSHCAVAADSDYAYIENNRTIDKAIREIRKVLLPEVSGPLYVDPSSGKLDVDVIKNLEAIANEPLEIMKRAKEISGMRVNIPTDQNVLSSSELVINIAQVPVGVARQIKVKIGYKLKV